MNKKVEIFRVLRYVGTPEFIAFHMEKRYVKGRLTTHGKYDGCTIEEAFLGECPAVVEEPAPIQDRGGGGTQ